MRYLVPSELVRSARRHARRALEAVGVVDVAPPDLDPGFLRIHATCRRFTMTSIERMYALHEAVKYVVGAQVAGALVECGVWRGGSMLLAAETLAACGVFDRELWLYDTFAGMTAPTAADRDLRGVHAGPTWRRAQGAESNAWCNATIDEVRSTMARPLTANGRPYPAERVHFVEGPVEKTLPSVLPSGQIAILRLDTDFFESTAHELRHLYPRLAPGGVLIVDDYGHWTGAREAVDAYFREHPPRPLLTRVDYTGRVAIKT